MQGMLEKTLINFYYEFLKNLTYTYFSLFLSAKSFKFSTINQFHTTTYWQNLKRRYSRFTNYWIYTGYSIFRVIILFKRKSVQKIRWIKFNGGMLGLMDFCLSRIKWITWITITLIPYIIQRSNKSNFWQ